MAKFTDHYESQEDLDNDKRIIGNFIWELDQFDAGITRIESADKDMTPENPFTRQDYFGGENIFQMLRSHLKPIQNNLETYMEMLKIHQKHFTKRQIEEEAIKAIERFSDSLISPEKKPAKEGYDLQDHVSLLKKQKTKRNSA